MTAPITDLDAELGRAHDAGKLCEMCGGEADYTAPDGCGWCERCAAEYDAERREAMRWNRA